MHTIRALCVLGALHICVATAAADDVGGVGTLVGLQMNTPSGDAYLQYHGRMVVKSAGGLDEYRWGGTSCGSRVLTDAEFAVVQRALDNKQLRVRPIYQTGQGLTRCLVGLSLVPSKFLKLGHL